MSATQQLSTRTLLAEIFLWLDEQQIPYCVMGGHEGMPDEVCTDVDLLLASETMRKLPDVLSALASALHAKMIQGQDHRTGTTFTLHRLVRGRTELLDLDFSDVCGDHGAKWVSNEQILSRKFRHECGFWVPAPADAFAYYLGKRAGKADFSERQTRRLHTWFEADPVGCREWMKRWLPASLVAVVERAICSLDAGKLQERAHEIVVHLKRESLLSRVEWKLSQLTRLLRRFTSPIGTWVVFLGPDGCGKSTVGDAALKTVEGAFRGLERFHLRPQRTSEVRTVVSNPYGKPARSFIQSVAKLGYFWLVYTLGYLRLVRPALVRNRLVAFDRYYCDLLADPRRYRFGGPLWLARLIGLFIPQPDLYLILDAPAEILQSRKQEVSLEQSEAQREAYLLLSRSLNNAVIVTASKPLEDVVAEVTEIIFEHVARRTATRYGLTRGER